MKTGGNSKDDLEGYVEHLRTIHFGLLLSCTALLIAAPFLPSREIYDALAQVRILRGIERDLNDQFLTNFVNDVAEEVTRYSQRIAHYEELKKANEFDIRGAEKRRELDRDLRLREYWDLGNVQKPSEFVNNESFCCIIKITDKARSHDYGVYIKPAPKLRTIQSAFPIPPIEKGTLKEAESAWNALVQNQRINIPWGWQVLETQVSTQNLQVSAITPTEPKVPHSKIYVSFSAEEILKSDALLHVPITTLDAQPTPLSFSLKLRIKPTYHQVRIKPGKWLTKIGDDDFNRTFEDMLSMIESLNIPPNSLQKIEEAIDTEIRSETKKSITLFGLEIPASIIRNWGSIIVIGFQLYFLIHLKFFSGLLKENHTFKVPWIGYYKDYLAKFMMIVVSLLMPVVTVTWLLVFQLYDPRVQFHFTLLLVIAISIVISFATRKYLVLIWKRL